MKRLRVGVALAVELGVQRPGADLDLRFQRCVHGNDGHAVAVLALVALLGDGVLDLLDREDGHVRVELAGDQDVVPVRRDVDTVRVTWLGNEVEDPLARSDAQLDDPHAVARDELARGDDLLGLLPVDHLQVVKVVLGRSDLEPRLVADGELGVERVG